MEFNFTIQNFILGLATLSTGFFLVAKAYYLNHKVLFLDWAEKRWGSGGGTMFYRWFGVSLCLFSFFLMFGIFNLTDSRSINPAENSSISPQSGGSQVVPSGSGDGSNFKAPSGIAK